MVGVKRESGKGREKNSGRQEESLLGGCQTMSEVKCDLEGGEGGEKGAVLWGVDDESHEGE